MDTSKCRTERRDGGRTVSSAPAMGLVKQWTVLVTLARKNALPFVIGRLGCVTVSPDLDLWSLKCGPGN
jgi:hypothetical protein